MRAVAPLLLLTVGAGDPPPRQPAPETPRDFYNAGTRQLTLKKLKEAEAMLENAVGSQADLLQPPALYNLGHTRFLLGLEELKKGPSASTSLHTSQATLALSGQAGRAADDALQSRVVAQMVDAYLRGLGARRQLKAATEAVKKAMATHSATLQKWERAAGDFSSAYELQPSFAQARDNANITRRHIARLVDSLRELQQIAAMLGQSKEELNQKMKQLKGQIPEKDMPPGAPGDDEEDEKQDGPEPGHEEASSKVEDEMKLTPEQAAWLLEGYRLDSERRLPMGQNNQSDPKEKNRQDW